MPGAIVLPAPDSYRSRFIDDRGVYDWKGELEFGFELIDAVERRVGGLHRRADPELGWRARAAGRLHGSGWRKCARPAACS